MKKIYRLLRHVYKSFVREYVANNIIAHIPLIWLRMWFYRRILGVNVSKNSNIQMKCYLYNSTEKLQIGANTTINRGCTLDRRGGLIIGDNVSIGPNVSIFTAGHDIQSSDFCNQLATVTISRYASIGSNASIMPGVTIGEGAVVLPGSVVTKSLGPYTINGGVPANTLSKRNTDLNYNASWNPWFL
jgi:acetyltransferase-like isoleucine patch superfamily enzyme